MGIVDEYFELKEDSDADLLAMQVGDFYEFFSDDARKASKELGLKLSEKSSHGSSHAMAGVPINDIEQYITTLVERNGYTVSIADQYEEGGQHKREISRVVTPGTLLESVESRSRYLASVMIVGDNNYGLSFTDLNSGRIYVDISNKDTYIDDISVYRPVEVLVSSNAIDKGIISDIQETVNEHTESRVHTYENQSIQELESRVREQFGDNILDSLSIEDKTAAIASAGKLLMYLDETGVDTQTTITSIKNVGNEDFMSLDVRSRRSLELTETISRDRGVSLVEVMDNTITSSGRDCLERYIQRPLKSRTEILERQESVCALVEESLDRRRVQRVLESYPNLPRIASKAAYGTASPRDLKSIADGFNSISDLQNLFENNQRLRDTSLYDDISDIDIGALKELKDEVESALSDNPPDSVDIGTINVGYDDELDALVEEHEEHLDWFSNLEDEIREQYDLSRVTIDRNKTDGYYIQVGKSEAHKIEDDFREVKKLKNSRRFETDKLNERERECLRLEEKREEIEKRIYDSLLEKIAENSALLQNAGQIISQVDAIQSMAVHAVENEWVKPELLEDKHIINVKNGRHPVVEQTTNFVPNDITLSRENNFIIVTGPNMAGKSTYLRQVALISLLAQIGSFVPATSARLGTFDSIFTRVGAMDEISQGKSTFMVEMSELANILHKSTNDSLVILDEVGRGTATCDGLSIAKATVEYLAEGESQVPFTLFATHYHELTSLSNNIEGVENYYVAVESGKEEGDYEFLYDVREGSADKSYGIKVADIAGVPNPVIDRARTILEESENNNDSPRKN